MFRKGQNYRVFIGNNVVAEETSCSITRGVDTESANNKDIAADSTSGEISGDVPVATYKTLTIQVEAQGVGAKTLFAAAFDLMKDGGGDVGFAPTTGVNNAVGTPTYYKAICNDLTINAPNQQPVTCSAQFTVIPGTPGAHTPVVPSPVDPATYRVLKGEFLRLFDDEGYAVVYATSVSLHVSLSMEESTTKDDDSTNALGYKSQTPTMINYDITSECLYGGGIGGWTEGDVFDWDICDASGSQQRTKGTALAWGTAMVTNIAMNAPVNGNITWSATLTGVGKLNPDTSDDDDSNEGGGGGNG